MDVGAQPGVIGEIPARIVAIGVEDDIVAIPKPVVAITHVGWSDHEEISVEVEAVWASAFEAIDVARAKFTREMAVFPRTIEVIAVVPAFVADPAVVLGVHMGSIGMPWSLGIIPRRSAAAAAFGRAAAPFGRTSGRSGSALTLGRCGSVRRWATRGDVPMANFWVLRRRGACRRGAAALIAAPILASALLRE